MSMRALPRAFVPGASADAPIELPKEELDKLRKVLRLSSGEKIAVLPNDGTLIVCELAGREAIPICIERPDSEPELHLTLAQALPKGDKLDEIVRACTEIGVSRFVLFPSDRTVVKWDAAKTESRARRLEAIAREAAEVSFRTRLPEFFIAKDLAEVLEQEPQAIVLSEVEGIAPKLNAAGDRMCIVVGPEGGWSRNELDLIGGRGVTLGPRVLRVDHAGAAAAAILLLGT